MRHQVKDGKSATYDKLLKPELSVIIPAFRRASVLKDVLGKYEKQFDKWPEFCVIVVDDGSGDDTRCVLKEFAERTKLAFRYISLDDNVGPARARNAALAVAGGKVILITGDDIIPSATFVSDHAKWHADHPDDRAAVLGRVTWPDELDATPFMRWLEGGGRKYFFNYADLPHGRDVGGQYFYTCNVSIKKVLLGDERFDEGFRYASHEDLELGNRLTGKGMQLFYEPSILAYHWHRLEVAKLAQRVYVMGYSAPIYWSKVADNSGIMHRLARGLFRQALGYYLLLPLWAVARKISSDRNGPFVWALLLFVSYWLGLRDAEKGRPLRDLINMEHMT